MRAPRSLLAVPVVLVVLVPALLAAVPQPAPPPALPAAGAAREGASFATLVCPFEVPDPLRPLERCNVRATTTNGPANEIDLAMDPKDPLHLVAVAKGYAYHRIVGGAFVGAVITPYATTFDGGLTWTEGFLQPVTDLVAEVPVLGEVGGTDYRESDPIVEFTMDGNVLVDTLRVANPNRGLPNYRSLDGGLTFDYVSHAYSGGTDKQWMVADPSTGNLYLVTLHQGGTGFVRSTDHGLTWSAVKKICECRLPGIDVGPGGVIHVVGMDGSRIWFTRSTDQGATWTTPVAIADHDGGSSNPFNLRLFRTPSIQQIASSRVDGGIYVVWSDHSQAVAGACSGAAGLCDLVPGHDILLLRSSDGGATWQGPVRVNDDPLSEATLQFMPQVAVSPNGRDVHVAWLDQRADPSGLLAEAYYAHSPDGGSTWDANLLLSDQPFLTTLSHHQSAVPVHTGVFVGDYIGLQASDDRAVVAWPDTRYGRADVFVATVV